MASELLSGELGIRRQATWDHNNRELLSKGIRMDIRGRATRIDLFNFSTPQMRAFHMSWFAFFLCFFAWFAIAPLMRVIREEMLLTKDQIGWCIIGSVAITAIARLLIGWLCDRIGPRLLYTWLLILGSIPVMGIGFAHDFTTFLLFRVAIGTIGASFVITQYHTSLMFAPNCIGSANATTAGWGTLGGGVTQLAMPIIFAITVSVLGFSSAIGWRFCMFVAGVICVLAGVAYYFLTQDTPEGNFSLLRSTGKMSKASESSGTFLEACKDLRVWALFAIYGGCFGIELIINSVLPLYFFDYFGYFKQMDSVRALSAVGLFASVFGSVNIFARTLGGALSDKFGNRWGLSGRVRWLFVAIFCEGIMLMLFSRMGSLVVAIPTLITFSMFVQMSEGATFAIVPFINRRALGSVSGIVGAGGNVGAVTAGFLFKSEALTWPTALFILGSIVTAISFLSFAVSFSDERESEIKLEIESAIAGKRLVPELVGTSE